jgi:hypothetical protein
MTWRDHYQVHPAADVFPMMSDQALAELGEDIKANGLKVPLSFCWVDTGTPRAHRVLIDGRNRLEAMERVGVCLQPQSNELPGRFREQETARTITDGDPVAHIISLNLRRRHLTPAEIANFLVKLAKMQVERETGSPDPVSRKGGRGKRSPVKAKALELNRTLPKGVQVSEPTIKRSIAKAEVRGRSQPKKIAGPRLRTKPKLVTHVGIDAARRYYLERCEDPDVDLDAEQEIIIDALREIAGKRATARQSAKDDIGDIPACLDRRGQT